MLVEKCHLHILLMGWVTSDQRDSTINTEIFELLARKQHNHCLQFIHWRKPVGSHFFKDLKEPIIQPYEQSRCISETCLLLLIMWATLMTFDGINHRQQKANIELQKSYLLHEGFTDPDNLYHEHRIQMQVWS